MMTSEMLAGYAGILLSLVCSYVPGLKERFAGLDPEKKRLVMLALLVVCAFAIYAAGCIGYLDAVSCDQAGIKKLVNVFIVAMVANQSVYAITPKVRG